MNDTGFRPTHVTPLDGMPTWAGPDPAEPSAWLDAVLPVRVVDTCGDWAQVQCSNGWAAWADGRLLIALPEAPPGAAQPLARTPDPRPLLARLERALSEYRQLVEQLAQGRLDLQTFRERSAGLRLGVIVDGESAWLLDLEHDRWWYCHDTQLQTFATVEAPPDVPGERPAPGPQERLSKPGAPSGEPAAAEDQPPASGVTGRVRAGER
ncbi:MAG: hypothetical protein ACJ786_27100 [Catenulispora sp.]